VDTLKPASAGTAGRVERSVRTAELVGVLSIATDLGTGQPLEHALRAAVLSVRLGELAGVTAQELADTHIYDKAGVRSRAAATLWAFEQDLLQAA
jgi:hypothetical protein